MTHQVADEADREVDEEDPAPVVVDRDVAAQRRADDRGGQPRHAEDRHRRALLLGREAVDQDSLTGGLEPAAGKALDHPEEDQLLEAGGKAAQHRCGGEDGDGQEEVPAAAQVGREPARDRQDGGVGRQVAGHNPVAVVHRRRQAARDVPHRGRGDRGVEDLHERGDHHGRGDEPGVDRRAADGVHAKSRGAHSGPPSRCSRGEGDSGSTHVQAFIHQAPPRPSGTGAAGCEAPLAPDTAWPCGRGRSGLKTSPACGPVAGSLKYT